MNLHPGDSGFVGPKGDPGKYKHTVEHLLSRATNFVDFVDFGDFHEICFTKN